MGLEQGTRARTARNTAEAFASLRAAGSSVRDDQVRNPDHLASRFIAVGPRLTALVKVPVLRPLARRTAERMSPGAYYYELARVKHIDRVLLEDLEVGLEQLVILGAGFDTRAYRFADQLTSVRVFELDHPVTAALKQARVRKIFGVLPNHVTYVSSDLEHEDLGLALQRAEYYGGREGRRRVEELGEPCVFGIDEGDLPLLLERHDMELVSDLGPAELERRYLIRRDGTVDGRPFGFISIAHARVPAANSSRRGVSARPTMSGGTYWPGGVSS